MSLWESLLSVLSAGLNGRTISFTMTLPTFYTNPKKPHKENTMEFVHFNPTTDPLMIGLVDKLMLMLDSAHDISDKIAATVYRITSGKRTADGNSILKGAVADSSHLAGEGCDLEVVDQFHLFRMIVGLTGAGFKRIGVYYKINPANPFNLIPIHLHVDCDETKPQEIYFTKVEQN